MGKPGACHRHTAGDDRVDVASLGGVGIAKRANLFGNTRLLVREEVAAVLIDQLERTAATASNAGQWFVSDVHVQTRLFGQQSIEVA